MKKFSLIALMLVLTAGILTGCRKSEEKPTDSTTASTQATVTNPTSPTITMPSASAPSTSAPTQPSTQATSPNASTQPSQGGSTESDGNSGTSRMMPGM